MTSELPYTLHLGNCLDVLKTLPDNSVDSIVTDPPYELGFMGKSWDASGIANNPAMWAECLRVLKPGGHLLAFSGSHTYHRMTCAIEDAGFEVRDQIMWVYGSGFPKSQNVSLAMDKKAGAIGHQAKSFNMKGGGARSEEFEGNGRDLSIRHEPITDAARQWSGWGTALKPAHEPICVARKPLIGTVAANVLAHGTGALNIDGCRIEASGRPALQVAAMREGVTYSGNALAGRVNDSLQSSKAVGTTDLGRWPANLIHDGSEEVLAAFPQASGAVAPVRGTETSSKTANAFGEFAGRAPSDQRDGGGSAARFFYCTKASRKDRNEGLADSGPQFQHGSTLRDAENLPVDSKGNFHPTVKPTDLMAYLCRLVTPPGGVVLDPFMGSGSTGKAAMREGFRFIGIDMTPEYVEIARARIEHEHGKRVVPPAPAVTQPDLFAEAAQ